MNLDNIPNNENAMFQFHEHLRQYLDQYSSLRHLLSYSMDQEFMNISFGQFPSSLDMINRTRRIEISSMPSMDYAEILYLVTRGIENEREGSMRMVEYVEVDKSESLYADLVKEQKDRHEAILEAVDALLASDIPADQAVAIQKIIKWREGISEKATESVLKPEDPRFRSNLDLEL